MAKEFCLRFICDSLIALELISQLIFNHVSEWAFTAAKALFSTIDRVGSLGVLEQRELIRNAVVDNHSASRGCGIVCSSIRIVAGSDMGTGNKLLQG